MDRLKYEVKQGDVLAVLKTMPDNSVQCVVTSPPYYGLRDYGAEGQIGLEQTPEEYVAKLVEVFREVRRVLRPDGVCWLNLGDSYNAGRNGGHPGGKKQWKSEQIKYQERSGANVPGLKPKDLIGIPWRVAFALQTDGWYLRQDIIWAKPNPMPESVTDRCTKSHEYLFLLTKLPTYYFDNEAIKEPGVWPAGTKAAKGSNRRAAQAGVNARPPEYKVYDGKRNKRSVWFLASKPFKGAHFAVFPEGLVEPCIKAGTSDKGCCPKCGKPYRRVVHKERTFESGSGRSGNMPKGKNGECLQGGGETKDIRRGPCVHSSTLGWRPDCDCNAGDPIPCLVLDPFSGSGTTGVVSIRFRREYVGIELNPEYVAMSLKRLEKLQLELL